jgi:hypothetical protein
MGFVSNLVGIYKGGRRVSKKIIHIYPIDRLNIKESEALSDDCG